MKQYDPAQLDTIKARMRPITGRQIGEDGLTFNVADAMARADSNNMWPFGETLTGQKRDDISLKYQYPYLNTDFDFRPPVLTGDGSVTQSGSVLQLSAVTGSAKIDSINATSYQTGKSGYLDFTASFVGTGSAIVGGDRAFQLRYNNGSLTFGYVKNGSFVSVPVDASGLSLNKMNVWRIVYGYLGSASPVLFVKRGKYKQVAIIETEGEISGTHVDDPNFVACYSVTGDCTLESGSFAAGVIGSDLQTGLRAFSFPNAPLASGTLPSQGDVTLIGTDVSTLAIFRSKATYKTVQNTVRAFLSLWSNYVESPDTGSGNVTFQVISNPALTGAPSYADVDVDNSVIEVDHTASTGASVSYSSGGRVVLQAQASYAAGQGNRPGISTFSTLSAEQLGASMSAGDVFVIIAKDKDGNGVTVRSTLGWKERF